MKADNGLDEVNRNRNSKKWLGGSRSYLRGTLDESGLQIGWEHEKGKKKSLFLQSAASNPWHSLACSGIALLSPFYFLYKHFHKLVFTLCVSVSPSPYDGISYGTKGPP